MTIKEILLYAGGAGLLLIVIRLAFGFVINFLKGVISFLCLLVLLYLGFGLKAYNAQDVSKKQERKSLVRFMLSPKDVFFGSREYIKFWH